MPKARDLFGPKKVIQNTNLEENFNDIESVRNLKAKVELKKRLIPRIDFATASNFAKFGSAELYYRSAMENISNQYPYDGSEAEKIEFLNSSSYIDLYVFENLYPRQNGYAIFSSDGWGTQASTADGYGLPSNQEYIAIRGTMNTASGGMIGKALNSTFNGSNLYDENPYDTLGLTDLGRQGTRTDNFLMDYERGVTIEFWMNKSEFITSSTEKEVIFDLWNGEASGSDSYGRLTLFVSGTADGSDPFRMNLISGSTGFQNVVLNTGQTTSSLADGNWHHYAVSIKNPTNENDRIKVYLDGELKATLTSALGFGEVAGGINARIGALLTAPSGTSAVAGAGKLSASLDEFRYWKAERSTENIAKYFRTNVFGGANTDISNTELGAYYKFNEGITQITDLDSTVLDYSGRISNGNWVGYPGSAARETGSAIVISNAAPQEFQDPTVYQRHPEYISTLNDLVTQGKFYDSQNTSMLYNTFPSFVIREDADNNLKNTIQIVANTFDELYLQIQEINKTKDVSYGLPSGTPENVEARAYPEMDRILQSVGLDTNDLFNNESLLEFTRNRNDKKIFKNPLDLTDVKNQIYSNIYNNAVHLLKSKGTQKSVRNFLRTIGISEQIVELKGYSSNRDYVIENRFENNLIPKKYISFDSSSLLNATIFQTASSNPNARGQFYVTGTQDVSGALTAEVNVFFPRKKDPDEPGHYTTNFLTSSIFGFHLLDSTSSYDFNSSDTSFQLIAVRPFEESKDAYFAIKSAAGSIYCSSSLYKEVYTGNEWTFAVSVFNDEQDYGAGVSGSSPNYLISLSGYNTEGYFVKDSFSVSGTLAEARATEILTTPKTYFAGADRTNFSGTVLTQTDVEIGHIRHYDNVVLSQEAIEAHAKDRNIFGTSRVTKNFSLFNAGTATGSYIPEASTILFNVDFQTVTGSDSSGEFLAVDFASGSTSADEDIRNDYASPYGAEFATQYEFKGFGFPASSTAFVDNKNIIGSDIQFPEQINSSDLVKVLTSDDEVFKRDFDPETLYYSLEKSFAGAFSREMIDFIGNVTEFNNIIGEAGALYREEYNNLDNLRTLFFQRVQSVKDFNEFYDYYKWFDDSVFNFILQLVPETANLRSGMQNIIENHILERDKVLTPYPQFRQVVEDTSTFGATLQGISDLDYNWKYGHAPVSDATNQSNNAVWWKQRAERTGSVGSGDQEVNEDIAAVKLVQQNRNLREYRKNFTSAGASYFKQDSQNNQIMENVSVKIEQDKTIFGGLNSTVRKDINLLRSIVSKFADADSDVRIRSDFTETIAINDDADLDDKRKRLFGIESFDGDLGPEVSNFVKDNVEIAFPGNILSASYSSPSVAGYNDTATNNINIGNIHLDYGLTNEIPMQGVFTEAHVGGLQYRHNDLNTSSATTERPEGYKIGYNASLQRVFLGPPQSNNVNITSTDTNLPYAPWTRDEAAKRPINIRNIKYSSGSQTYGNYIEEYELMQLNGRSTNNPDFVKAEGFGTGSITSSFITDVVDYIKPTRPARKHIIVNRFSAPGDPLTAGDNQGGVGLDYEAAELSPYSHLNYRNLVTRLPLNNIFLVDHAVSGGFSSDQSNIGSSLYNPSNVTSVNYLGTSSVFGVGVPSFHKTQRAGHLVRYSGSADDFATGSGASDTTKTLYDNYYVVSSLPGTELRYAWITSSYESSYVLGYQTPTGEVSTSAGLISEIVFTSGSDRNSSLSFVGANLYVVTDGLKTAVPTIDTNTLTVSFPSTSSVLVNDFILNTNGPYGNPTFKQVRVGENRVNRYLRANNLFTYPGSNRSFVDGDGIERFDATPETLVTTQSVVTCRYEPVEFLANIDGVQHRFNVENGNQKVLFSQDVINRGYDIIDGSNESAFDNFIGVFNNDDSYTLDLVKFRETVWPSEENSYLEKVRERVGFVNNFWRNDAQNRSDNGPKRKPYGVRDDDALYLRSVWDLDTFRRFELANFRSGADPASGISTPGANTFANPNNTRNAGILQNFTTFNKYAPNPSVGTPLTGTAATLNVQPTYARNHFMQEIRSVVSPHGLDLVLDGGTKISSFAPSAGGTSNTIYSLIGSGFASWQAGAQAGIFTASGDTTAFLSKSSAPFDDTYDDYNLDIKSKKKDLSIIPEYISSDFVGLDVDPLDQNFVQNYKIKLANPASDTNRPLLRGLPSNSSLDDFFKIYSHSDFLKYFKEVKEGGESNGLEASSLTLKFKGIKKFLPYNGFYPAERSTEVAKQFFNTYGEQSFTIPDDFNVEEVSPTNRLRPIMQTLFAPGLLYNSIKSGMAVDYPIYTDTYQAAQRPLSKGITRDTEVSGTFVNRVSGIRDNFHERIPFEALYNPSLLNGKTIVDNENTQFSRINSRTLRLRNDVSITDQDSLYINIANNYLAECVNFFLEDGRTTRILSAPQRDFKTVTPGRAYGMRVKMYRSLDKPKLNSGSYGNYPVPQILEESGTAPKAYIYLNKGLVAGVSTQFTDGSTPCLNSFPDGNWNSTFATSFTLSGATAGSWTISGLSEDNGSAEQDDQYDAAGNDFKFNTQNAGVPLGFPADINYQSVAANLVSVLNLHPNYEARQFDTTIDYTDIPGIAGPGCASTSLYEEFVVVEITSNIYEDNISLAVSNSATPVNTDNGLDNFFFVSNTLLGSITEDITTQTDDTKARIGTGSFTDAEEARGFSRPTVTMYSRPSAFGPPTIGLTGSTDSSAIFSGTYDSLNGYNMPYTPPYYDGEAWIDIIYVPQGTSLSGTAADSLTPFKPVVSGDPTTSKQLFSFPDAPSGSPRQDGLFVNYWRFDKEAGVNPGTDVPARDGNLNTNAMQLSATLNTFEVVGEGENARWSIELKFETPILNFGHLAGYNAVTQPTGELSASVPRGMWHQFGRIPLENEGMYLKIEPIPDSWLNNHPDGVIGSGRDGTGIGATGAGNAYTIRPFGDTSDSISPVDSEPLSDICGFANEPIKLGKLKTAMTVREAVVAIPFRDVEGTKQLFDLVDETEDTVVGVKGLIEIVQGIENSPNPELLLSQITELSREQYNSSVGQQIRKMLRYNFPPYLDFVKYPEEVTPYSAYIFEFEHTFDQDDLNYIWQNLRPLSGQKLEEVEQTVSHNLRTRDLLGTYKNTVERVQLPDDIQWMVFKVKQKAKTNYERDILGKPNVTVSEQDYFNYNWPYDHFSLIEMGKLDVNVNMISKQVVSAGITAADGQLRSQLNRLLDSGVIEEGIGIAPGEEKDFNPSEVVQTAEIGPGQSPFGSVAVDVPDAETTPPATGGPAVVDTPDTSGVPTGPATPGFTQVTVDTSRVSTGDAGGQGNEPTVDFNANTTIIQGIE